MNYIDKLMLVKYNDPNRALSLDIILTAQAQTLVSKFSFGFLVRIMVGGLDWIFVLRLFNKTR